MTGREGERQFLDDGRTRVAENLRRDVDDADVLVVLGLAEQFGDTVEALLAVGRAEVALGRKVLDQRVDDEHDAGVFLGYALLFEFGQHQVGEAPHLLAAEYEVDGRQVDVAQERVELGGREVGLGDVEAQRVDARTQELQRFGVGRRSVGDGHRLVYAPAVVGVRAAYVGELARLRAQEAQTFEVLGAVVGPHVESFARAPYQFAFVVSTFQVGRNRLFPLCGRHGREFGEQLFLFGICHNYFEIS